MKKMITLSTLLFLLDGSAYAGVDTKDASVTITTTNTWQQIAKPDGQRNQINCMNLGTHNMGFYPNTYANGSTAPTPTGIGSAGVFTVAPLGSYAPNGDPVWGGALWVIGTSGDVMTCKLSPTQP